ncbi:MAG: hypothetical protein ACOX0U_01345 [Oscillospiraceae bacterium]|jgi:hypothetical protein
MKKKLLSLLLAAGGLGVVALAAVLGGSASDPLISLHYLNDTYLTSVLRTAQEKIETAGDAAYEEALDYLDAKLASGGAAGSGLPGQKGYLHANGFLEMRLKKGDVISGITGTGAILWAGKLSVSFSGGAMIDVTSGKTVASGTALVPQQRYLTGENAKPSFVVQSDTAVVSIDGFYTLKKSTQTDYNQLADALRQIGLFKGKDISIGSGYALEDKGNRIEGLIMFLRMLGQEEEALSRKTPHPFTDVPDWCNGYVAYAYEKGYTTGVSKTSFGTYQEIGAAEYMTFLLRSLGYRDADGEFTWDTSLEKAKTAGVITAGERTQLTGQPFYRAQMVYLSYYGLLAQRKTGETLLTYLDAQGALQKTQVERIMASVTSNRIL